MKRSLTGLVEIENDPRILSVQVIGNAAHEYFSLPPSCNREMGKHVTWLGEHGIQTVNASMLCTGGNMTISIWSTTHTTESWCTATCGGAITSRLKYKEIMSCREQLRRFAINFIESDTDRRDAVRLFPTIIQFRLALARAQEVMLALTPQEKTSTPAQEFDKADEEILMWVQGSAGTCYLYER